MQSGWLCRAIPQALRKKGTQGCLTQHAAALINSRSLSTSSTRVRTGPQQGGMVAGALAAAAAAFWAGSASADSVDSSDTASSSSSHSVHPSGGAPGGKGVRCDTAVSCTPPRAPHADLKMLGPTGTDGTRQAAAAECEQREEPQQADSGGQLVGGIHDQRQAQQICVSSPTEATGGGGGGGGWWTTLTGKAAEAQSSAATSSSTDSKAAEGHEESEGWWAWATGRLTGAPPPAPPVVVPLSLGKLTCKLHGGRDGASRQPVVLLACGSFNPPTIAHLRMFELATDALTQEGYDVLGGYMSPVNDAYGKPDLIPAHHRVQMAELATASSRLIMVDGWEAAQPGWQRTLAVMHRLHSELSSTMHPPDADATPGHTSIVPALGPSREALDSLSSDAADFPGSHSTTTPASTPATTTTTPSAPSAAASKGAPPPPPSGPSAAILTGQAAQARGLRELGRVQQDEEEEATVGSYTTRSAHAHFPSPSPAPAPAPRPGAALATALPVDTSAHLNAAAAEELLESSSPSQQGVPRVMLLCGADMVESFAAPGVWREEHLRRILGPDHGVVCIARRGSDVRRVLSSSQVLGPLAGRVKVVEEPVAWDLSSSHLRDLLKQGKSIKYLTPDAVVDYIRVHHLYDSQEE